MSKFNNSYTMASKDLKQLHDVAVLMVPFPLQGHLNQLLHLSRLISSYEVIVHYVSTTIHNRQARQRIHGWDPMSMSNIVFHEFPSLSYQNFPPNPNASIQFPSHLQPLFDALPSLRGPVTELLHDLCAVNRRVVIIYDSLMGSVIQDFVKFPNTESYIFHSVSAYTIFFFLWENMGRPFSIDPKMMENLPSPEGCFSPEFLKFVIKQHKYLRLNSGRIYNTCRVVENLFLELLENPHISGNKKQWALGPFNPVSRESDQRKSESTRHTCLKWLDLQNPSSVIFLSFGTTTTLSQEQIYELAIGLENTNVNFIWVLRDADSGSAEGLIEESDDKQLSEELKEHSTGENKKVGVAKGFKKQISEEFDEQLKFKKAELPKGFEERLKKRGIVVRDWAPQLDILGHSAVGGFMSHCGWNSCIESISMGVPMAAWPMHSDQPRNTVLVTDVLKIGVAVKDWTHRDELVKSSAIEKVIIKLMASEDGEEMRKKATELGVAVREAVAEGGSTHSELNCFISHITR